MQADVNGKLTGGMFSESKCDYQSAAGNILDRSRTPPVPEGTQPLSHQVAGHVFGRENGQKKNKIGFLQSNDGCVLKPVLDRKGQREIEIYERMFDNACNDVILLSLRKFVPNYLGIWTTPAHPGQSYLKLEDVTRRFKNPSLMDVKIGRITYDPEADEAKKLREISKFPALDKLGFQVVGVKLYDAEKGAYRSLERTFLRSLNENTILNKGLGVYFGGEESQCNQHLINSFLHRLLDIKMWFMSQKSYCFIASSLLFMYDAKALRRCSLPAATLSHGSNQTTANGTCSQCSFVTETRPCADCENSQDGCIDYQKSENENFLSENNNFADICDVRIIDLTHVFTTAEHDTNYLHGLSSLVGYISRLKPK